MSGLTSGKTLKGSGENPVRMGEQRAVVLLSGGLDSATTLAIAKRTGAQLYALTFDYGQRHVREVESARKLAKHYKCKEHQVLKLDLAPLGGSALIDSKSEIPLDRSVEQIAEGIPPTYVPARNTILLSFAMAYAEGVKANRVYIGANAIDYSGYPDCRPEYYRAFQKVAQLATKRAVEGSPVIIEHPLLWMSKSEIVREAVALGVPMELTWSCYLGGETSCGRCDSCQIRQKGFQEAEVSDPLPYA